MRPWMISSIRPYVLGLLGAHEEVAIRVGLIDLDRLAAVLREDLVEPPAHAEDLLRVDLDICRLSLNPPDG